MYAIFSKHERLDTVDSDRDGDGVWIRSDCRSITLSLTLDEARAVLAALPDAIEKAERIAAAKKDAA